MSRKVLLDHLTQLAALNRVDLSRENAKEQVRSWLESLGNHHDSDIVSAFEFIRENSDRGWPSFPELRDALRNAKLARIASSEAHGASCSLCDGHGTFALPVVSSDVYGGSAGQPQALRCTCPLGSQYPALAKPSILDVERRRAFQALLHQPHRRSPWFYAHPEAAQ